MLGVARNRVRLAGGSISGLWGGVSYADSHDSTHCQPRSREPLKCPQSASKPLSPDVARHQLRQRNTLRYIIKKLSTDPCRSSKATNTVTRLIFTHHMPIKNWILSNNTTTACARDCVIFREPRNPFDKATACSGRHFLCHTMCDYPTKLVPGEWNDHFCGREQGRNCIVAQQEFHPRPAAPTQTRLRLSYSPNGNLAPVALQSSLL